MPRRRDRSRELRELAGVLYRLMREHEISTHERLKVSPSLSRILSHAREWRQLRRRSEKDEGSRVAKEPSFFTVVDAANELKVPVCALVPTIEHQPLTPLQRKVLTLMSRWMLANFGPRAKRSAGRTGATSTTSRP